MPGLKATIPGQCSFTAWLGLASLPSSSDQGCQPGSLQEPSGVRGAEQSGTKCKWGWGEEELVGWQGRTEQRKGRGESVAYLGLAQEGICGSTLQPAHLPAWLRFQPARAPASSTLRNNLRGELFLQKWAEKVKWPRSKKG